MAKKYLDDTGMSYFWGKLKAYFQEKLVSGTNIKTINNESVLGSGNIQVPAADLFATKSATSSITVAANAIGTINITANNSNFQMIKGFSISAVENLVMMQCYFSSSNTITVRVKNVTSSSQTGNITAYYC